jgi:hypothetical protein
MVSVQQAVGSAVTFAQGLFEGESLRSLRLEEVDAGDVNGRPVWQITLSMTERNSPLSALSLSGAPREYKIFTVDKATGDVLSMKIRELAGA